MLAKPNVEQQRIIDCIDDNLLILAPVGSGKTEVLAERALHAVRAGIPAKRILCLTFTNRAAEQMRKRVASYNSVAARQATIRTFHSLCAYILRSEARTLGLPSDYVIYDDVDSQELIAEVFGYSRADDKAVKQIYGRLSDCKSRANPHLVRTEANWKKIFEALGDQGAVKAARYQRLLLEQHALDFADLVYFTRVALGGFPDICARWAQRYDFIQVDEVQDTHLAEYEIVRTLAQNCRSIALIGDIDQTIYTWRGSQPELVMAQYQSDFAPKLMPLTLNYRATRTLLLAADSFARRFNHRHTTIVPAPECEEGERIRVHRAANPEQEARWIGQQLRALSQGRPDYPYHRIAVLARTNQRASTVAGVLGRMDIPCLTVEAFEFFQRQEIKDALSYLRTLVNPNDKYAVHRMLLRPRRRIGQATTESIQTAGDSCGLRLTDMVRTSAISRLDPYALLLDCCQNGELVVFDVETTGFSPGEDEIVELAATKVRAGKPVDHFHRYLRTTHPVGETEAIHGYSDAFLAVNGLPAGEVFAEFAAFSEGAILVGHNVGFDVSMVSAQARRLGLDWEPATWYDTWNMSERFVRAENYRLATMAEHLQLHVVPTHQASADVDATVALLGRLIPLIEAGMVQRQKIVAQHGQLFGELARQVEGWRQLMVTLRPADLLARIMDESGLAASYQDDPDRADNLQRLASKFHHLDPTHLHPETALRTLLDFTSLAKNVDLLSEAGNEVVAITIHQAKGLEFDTVFIAGATENELPSWFSINDGDIEEEKRLFYVALTRAKKILAISGHAINERGFHNDESRFVNYIASNLTIRQ